MIVVASVEFNWFTFLMEQDKVCDVEKDLRKTWRSRVHFLDGFNDSQGSPVYKTLSNNDECFVYAHHGQQFPTSGWV